VDRIHGDLSTLTKMVSQLTISLGKRPDAGGTPLPTTPVATTTTPPHSYHSNLSPIPEASTPMNSASPATARPLHFGNLSPRHLPHPEFPTTTAMSKSQSIAGPSSAAPLAASAPTTTPPPPPPPPTHIQQHTNPFTQPQYYSPSPHGTTQTQSLPFYPYPPPNHPQYTHFPPYSSQIAPIHPSYPTYYPPSPIYPPPQATFTPPLPTILSPPTYPMSPSNIQHKQTH
jgi:hypothetical protein